MKFLASASIFLAFAIIFQHVEGLRGIRAERNLEERGVWIKRILQEKDQIVHFTPSHFDGCIQAQGKSNSSDAILTVDTPFCTKFTVDNDGLIHASDSNLCLQAGHGKVLQDGSKMRLYPCDRKNLFQKFAWTGSDGRLKLKSLRHDDLCVTFRGDRADYSDPIIFKKCHAIPSTHTQWKATPIAADAHVA